MPPDKRGPRVRHETLNEQRGAALGLSHSRRASQKRRPESWAREAWGLWGQVEKRKAIPDKMKNKQGPRGAQASSGSRTQKVLPWLCLRL